MIRLLICAAVAATAPLFAQETLTDNSGQEFRRIASARYLRGFDAGERAINYAFPLMSTGQFFGNAEKPAHWTWITKPFYLATSEVTVAQFRAFVEDTDYVTTAERTKAGIVGWSPTPADKPLYQSYDFEKKPEFTWRNPGFEQQDDHPVVGVSWQDAQSYCKWLSKMESATYRLPTEAEWELAAKGGTQTWFSWGDEARNMIHRHANIGNVELERFRAHAAERHWLLDLEKEPADQHVFTAPVGRYEANPFELHDMGGNVWEWCQDYYLDTYYQNWKRPDQFTPEKVAADPVNASEPQTEANQFRVIRGGSWYTGPLQVRPANRGFYDEPDAAAYLGFRVLREIPGAEPNPAHAAELAAMTTLQGAGVRMFDRDRDKAYEVEVPGEGFKITWLQQLLAVGPVDSLRLESAIEVDGAIVKAVAQLKSLETFTFDGDFTGQAADLEALATLAHLRGLSFPRRLSISDAHLEALEKLSTLEEITIHSPQGGLTDAGVRHLASNRELRSLRIYESEADGSFLDSFIGVPLETLAIQSQNLTDEHAAKLSQFSQLREINISSPYIARKGMEAIATLRRLERLNLRDCGMLTDADCALLGDSLKLQSLDLTGVAAGDLTADAIAHFDELAELRIGSAALTDVGTERISRIMSLQTLQIEKGATAITDAGLAELSRLRRLRRLKVYSPIIRGEGLAGFQNIVSLQDLTIPSPALTDEAFTHLSRCDSLLKLWLVDQDTQPAAALTNDGLFQMQRLKNLREIWLPRQHTQMTEEKMLELNELMPKCTVIPYSIRWKPE